MSEKTQETLTTEVVEQPVEATEVEASVEQQQEPEEKIELVEYDGWLYRVFEYIEDEMHIEPCWNCAFGYRVSIGKREAIVKGEKKLIDEGGYGCRRPRNFPQNCTAVNRDDRRNVFFGRYCKVPIPDENGKISEPQPLKDIKKNIKDNEKFNKYVKQNKIK